LTSQYILSLLLFVVRNLFFSTNNENHNLDTRQRNNLYLPQANNHLSKRSLLFGDKNF